ncbi:MAG: pyrroline-5-carboxylate reductase [Phycisphaerales bacterium]|nr:pyrroline-5-carboxylate reductase [Phycisphaerales bacterium]|tara:strand:- start:6473 stop:7288 length:816 start_codon:yes stop_codon:yes gene_type:complete
MSKNSIQIGFLGCGDMGGMLLEAALQAGILTTETVHVAERNADKRETLSSWGIDAVESAAELAGCDRIILAVRPQQFQSAAEELGDSEDSRLAISIMAGIGSDTIRESLGESTRVICCMPNAPVKIHAGVTALMPAQGSTDEDLRFASSLFDTIGSTEVLPESTLWAVTAVSGSGPGYISLVAEAMLQEAVQQGLDPTIARRMIARTIAGTGQLLVEHDDGPEALRMSVTTPGGTTEAGIRRMQELGLVEAVRSGIKAAHDRGESLADGNQ